LEVVRPAILPKEEQNVDRALRLAALQIRMSSTLEGRGRHQCIRELNCSSQSSLSVRKV
jgi:hypothetical protein